jgi:hypothetical protein
LIAAEGFILVCNARRRISKLLKAGREPFFAFRKPLEGSICGMLQKS